MKNIPGLLHTFYQEHKNIIVNLIFFLTALAFAYYFTLLRFTLNSEYYRATVASILSYTADTPFQYRVLMAWLVHFISDFVPSFHLPQQLWITTSIQLEQARVVVLLEMLSVFSIVISFRYFLNLILKNTILSIIFSFSIILVLPFNYLLARFAPFWSIADLPALLFFTIGLYFLYQRNWISYYILFTVAIFNRETIAFLTVIFLFTAFRRMPLKTIVLHCIAQGIIWLGIKLILFQMYGHNQGEGTIIEPHVLVNLEYLKTIKYYPLLLSNFGFLGIPVFLFYKEIEDTFIKRCLLAFVFTIPLHLVTSSILEIRVFQEFIPVIVTAYILIIKSLIERNAAKALTWR